MIIEKCPQIKFLRQWDLEFVERDVFPDLLTMWVQDDSEAPPRKLLSCGDIDIGGKQRSNEDKDEVAENGLVWQVMDSVVWVMGEVKSASIENLD